MRQKMSIECPCEKAKKFEKTFEFKDDENAEGTKSIEMQCPVCDKWISLEFDHPLPDDHRMLILRDIDLKGDVNA